MNELYVKRSPAKVCWWVMYEGTIIETRRTKAEALKLCSHLNKLDMVSNNGKRIEEDGYER